MTYFGVDVKKLPPASPPAPRNEWGDAIVGSFVVAVILLALGGYIA